MRLRISLANSGVVRVAQDTLLETIYCHSNQAETNVTVRRQRLINQTKTHHDIIVRDVCARKNKDAQRTSSRIYCIAMREYPFCKGAEVNASFCPADFQFRGSLLKPRVSQQPNPSVHSRTERHFPRYSNFSYTPSRN